MTKDADGVEVSCDRAVYGFDPEFLGPAAVGPGALRLLEDAGDPIRARHLGAVSADEGVRAKTLSLLALCLPITPLSAVHLRLPTGAGIFWNGAGLRVGLEARLRVGLRARLRVGDIIHAVVLRAIVVDLSALRPWLIVLHAPHRKQQE
jgi:hypothetical protein